MTSHRVEYRIYIEDTDMMNIVYHANYVKFFERARTEWLRQKGIYLTHMSKDDTYFAIKRIEVDYKAPACLDDLIMIETTAQLTGFCQMRFVQKMYNQSQKFLAGLEAEVVCVSGKMNPKRLPKEISKELCS